VPPGHGTYQGLDLERLDPEDEDQRTFLLEAQHLEIEEALEHHEEMTGPDGEPVTPAARHDAPGRHRRDSARADADAGVLAL
jgi:hypothetical protein